MTTRGFVNEQRCTLSGTTSALCAEGWAMLSAVLTDLVACEGFRPAALVEPSLLGRGPRELPCCGGAGAFDSRRSRTGSRTRTRLSVRAGDRAGVRRHPGDAVREATGSGTTARAVPSLHYLQVSAARRGRFPPCELAWPGPPHPPPLHPPTGRGCPAAASHGDAAETPPDAATTSGTSGVFGRKGLTGWEEPSRSPALRRARPPPPGS
jgi:hypothetical protein